MSSNLVEAIYFIPTKILSQKEFSTECTFREILDYFILELFPKYRSKVILKKNYYYKQYKINETTKMKDLLNLKDFPENITPKIYIKLNDLMSKEYDDTFTFLLKPKLNPLGFIIYSVKTNIIYQVALNKNLIKTHNLDKYNPDNSAYCNSYEALYISGGSKPNRDPISDFWIIYYNYSIKNKKFNFKVTYFKMPIEKKQHSMLFDKKENVIYIIGGNDKTCLKYDINTKIFWELPETIATYIKPALLIKNDVLYVFDSFDKRKLCFEKLDLVSIPKKKQTWEKIYPKNYEKFISQYYGICDMDLEDKVIFLGGERYDNNIIVYETKNNKLEKGEGKNSYAKLNDKNFYKINKNFYISIPEFRVKENWLISIDNITHDVSKIYFDEEGKTIFNFDSIDECDISLEPVFKKVVKTNKNLIKSNSGVFLDDVEEKKEEKNEKTILKSKMNLDEIKKSNDNNIDINSNKENKELNKLETVEINIHQEIKDDKDSDKIYILREPFDSRKIKKFSLIKKLILNYHNLKKIALKVQLHKKPTKQKIIYT